MRLRTSICVLTGVFLLQSCSSDEKPVQAQDDSLPIMAEGRFHAVQTVREKYEVTYHDDTVIVSEDAMYHLLTVSDDQETLEFEAEAMSMLNLERGKVTIFPLTALRRVTSWQEVGGKIIVKTTPAILTEAIKDADIELVTNIGWKVLNQQTSSTKGIGQLGPIQFRLIPAAHAAGSGDGTIDASESGLTWSDSITFKRKLGKGLEAKLKLKPESWDKLGFDVTVTASKEFFKKSLTPSEVDRQQRTEVVNPSNWFGTNSLTRPEPGIVNDSDWYGSNVVGGREDEAEPESTTEEASMTLNLSVGDKLAVTKASGFISGFTSGLGVQIDDSALQGFSYSLRNVHAEMKLEAASLKDVVGTANFKVPLEIAIPMRVGLIPVTLKVGAEASFRPIVHDGSAKLCFMIKTTGDTGISYKNGSLKNESDAQDRLLTTCPESETVSAGKMTVGMGSTIKFPSISLEIFGKAIVPNVHIKLDGQTLFEPGILNAQPACQSGSATLAAIMAIKLKFLSAEIERTAKLWESKKKWNCDDKVVKTTFDARVGEQTTVSER